MRFLFCSFFSCRERHLRQQDRFACRRDSPNSQRTRLLHLSAVSTPCHKRGRHILREPVWPWECRVFPCHRAADACRPDRRSSPRTMSRPFCFYGAEGPRRSPGRDKAASVYAPESRPAVRAECASAPQGRIPEIPFPALWIPVALPRRLW